MAGRILDLLSAAVGSFSREGKAEVVELKLAYLEEAYRFATAQGRVDKEKELILLLGHSYLELAQLLPREECYDKGHYMACFCFNIALEGNRCQKQLTQVEQGYLEKMVDSFDHLEAWASQYIWLDPPDPGLQQAHVLHVAQMAERLIDYGQIDIARSLYAQAVEYTRKHPFRGSEEISDRHLELANMAGLAPKPHGWQLNRKILLTIRQLTTFLFSTRAENVANPDRPVIPHSFSPTITRCLAAIGLDEDLDQLLANEALQAQLSIHQIQQLHGALMAAFSNELYTQAIAFIGPPPCTYSLVGLGSLARGEFAIYSDLDAIVLVDSDEADVVPYFSCVACYFELLMMNLGETKFDDFLGSPHGLEGFRLDPAALHPRRMILTQKQFIHLQKEWLQHLGPDIDPVPNALRLPCYIGGDPQLFEQCFAALDELYAADKQIGSYLLAKWKGPDLSGDQFDAKQDLYRPITLLIDALSVKLGAKLGITKRTPAYSDL